jgi:hypothetical protein
VNDDALAGYSIGSEWDDTANQKTYRCLDTTAGAAVWVEITAGAAGGEANTSSNVGTGTGLLAKAKVGVNLPFKSLKEGAGIAITNNTDDVTIASRGAQTEVDFGSTPVRSTKFTISDASVLAGGKIVATLAYDAPTGRTIDEVEMEFDNIFIAAGNITAGVSFDLYVGSGTGMLSGKYKINYSLH